MARHSELVWEIPAGGPCIDPRPQRDILWIKGRRISVCQNKIGGRIDRIVGPPDCQVSLACEILENGCRYARSVAEGINDNIGCGKILRLRPRHSSDFQCSNVGSATRKTCIRGL